MFDNGNRPFWKIIEEIVPFAANLLCRDLFNIGKGTFWNNMEKDRFALKDTLEKEHFAENAVL